MDILDEGNFNKNQIKGNHKYSQLARDGMEYHHIREIAVKDGLEGEELSLVMKMVDNILIAENLNKNNIDTAWVMIIIGAIIIITGLGITYYTYTYVDRVYFMSIIMLLVGMSMFFGGLTRR